MKIKKFFRKFLCLSVSLTLLIGLFTIAFPQYIRASVEDFSGYTEVDDGGDITVISDRITYENMSRGDDSYVYKDYGVDYFSGDFDMSFEFWINDFDVSLSSQVNVWALANNIGHGYSMSTTHYAYVHIQHSTVTGKPKANMGTKTTGGSSIGIEYETLYYALINYVDSTRVIKLYLYTDAGHTDLVGQSETTIGVATDWRYLYGLQAWGWAGSQKVSGYIQNLNRLPTLPPTTETKPATNIEYNDAFGLYDVDLNANLTDDGNEQCIVGFEYKLQSSENWTYCQLGEYYNTSDNYTFPLMFLEAGDYDFRAWASHGADTTWGSTLQFTAEYPEGLAEVVAYSYPMVLDYENAKAQLYGKIVQDGSSNCTASFQYRLTGSENWTATDNITDLTTGSTFDFWTSANLTRYTNYDYRAKALNDTGLSYSSIGNFYLSAVLVSPIVTSDNVTGITSTDIWLHGTLIEDGDGDGDSEAWVRFQYRVLGDSIWLQTPVWGMTSNETFSMNITNLTPETNYEWRAKADNAVLPANQQPTGYGETKIFYTFGAESIPIITSDSSAWLSSTDVRLRGLINFDGGYVVTVWFQYRLSTEITWTDSIKAYGGYTDYEFNQIISNLEANKDYEWRGAGSNLIGAGYGGIETFYTGATAEATSSDDEDTLTMFEEMVTGVRESLHLTGVMGTWAFMGLVILVISLLFGIGMIAVPLGIARIAVAVAWLLASIAVVGAFIFTGQLGIWPILILVGGVVALIMIVLTVRLSGGNQNG